MAPVSPLADRESALPHRVRSALSTPGRNVRPNVTLALVTGEVEQELDDRWWLGLRARRVESVDTHGVQVVLNFGQGCALTIEAVASIRTSLGGTDVPALTHGEDGTVSTFNALLSLVGQQVLSAVAFKSGKLRIVLESGALLTVPPGEQYEAWQLTGPSGRIWVSVPGGGLTTSPGGNP